MDKSCKEPFVGLVLPYVAVTTAYQKKMVMQSAIV
jgi:hypothetical protein